ncbi:MAG: glutamate 5-kinase [Pseudomonadota bacterium]
MSAQRLAEAKRIVVKVGSALIAEASEVRQDWLNALSADITALRGQGKGVILVCSGSIAIGRRFLGEERPRKLADKQAAAALGQPLLMAALSDAFALHNVPVAQSLLTIEDTENRRRWLNARATINALLGANALPVINENDTVATDEIRYGDNDRLAARVAQMMGAEVLVLLSDIDGLYTADPRTSSAAEHVPIVTDLTDDIVAMAGEANVSEDVGSGGMVTKLAAAKIALAAGCATAIALGDRRAPLRALSDGAKATWIIPAITPDKAREAWLRGHLALEGVIYIDKGAQDALAKGASLLPVGLTAVEGQFGRGAAIAVKSQDGDMIGKGLTAYSSDDAAAIIGLRSEDVEAKLGYRGRPAIVHRDDFVFEGD